MRIVLLGKPGSGKGTQAAMLSADTGLPHLSSGEILRRAVEERTPLGVEVESYMMKGEIGPDDLIASAVLEHIEREGLDGGYILDGFPRTILQASMLDERYRPDRCFLIEVSDLAAARRIEGRIACRSCGAVYHLEASPPAKEGLCDSCGGSLSARKDDSGHAVERRLDVFRQKVMPVVRFYADQGRLQYLEGERSPEDVYEDLRKTLSRPSR